METPSIPLGVFFVYAAPGFRLGRNRQGVKRPAQLRQTVGRDRRSAGF